MFINVLNGSYRSASAVADKNQIEDNSIQNESEDVLISGLVNQEGQEEETGEISQPTANLKICTCGITALIQFHKG